MLAIYYNIYSERRETVKKGSEEMQEMTDGERATNAELKAYKYKLLWEISEAERLGMNAEQIISKIKDTLQASE